jgi:hypothetical protein
MLSGIPRELGGAMIAFMLIFVATSRFSYRGVPSTSQYIPETSLQ